MSKNQNKNQETMETMNASNEIVKIDSNVILSTGEIVDFETLFNDSKQFQRVGSPLLNAEMLSDLAGVKARAVLRSLSKRTLDGQEKEGVDMFLETVGGPVQVWASQFKFIQAFSEYDKGNGVAIMFEMKGKIQLKGGRTMNDIDILARSL